MAEKDGEKDAAKERKRNLNFCVVDTFVCPKVTDVREAARLWASKNHEVVGSFRQPYLQPSLQMRTTAVCYKCEGCHRFDGKTFEFLASDSEDGAFTKLTVSTAGDCNGDARTSMRSAGQTGKGPRRGRRPRSKSATWCTRLLIF